MLAGKGGYDEGYGAVPCFWGDAPSSFVTKYLQTKPIPGRAWDVGCGEGKNANALVRYGFAVDAIDCSVLAVENGRRKFPDVPINWSIGDVADLKVENRDYDLVVSYGLFHCLGNEEMVRSTISLLQDETRVGGVMIVCAFNDGPHDLLSAHPNFHPLLLPHDFYVGAFADWEMVDAESGPIHETHPHNGIPHYHSVSRIMARKAHG